jgi:hypothetical protein
MGVIEEIQGFLFWALFNALIPTSILFLLKVLGCFPFVWKWVLLPLASVGFFFLSFYAAFALVALAYTLARKYSNL